MAILTYESDGFSVSPAFLRQVEVHIQQVLNHRRQRTGPEAGWSPIHPPVPTAQQLE